MVQHRLLGSAHHQQYGEAYGHGFSLVEMAPEWREHFQLEYERARLDARHWMIRTPSPLMSYSVSTCSA